jgi:hypothetical protein
MNEFDQLAASPPLTSWLVITGAAWARMGIAGLFAGNWQLFRPINMNRVDRTEPGKTANERRVRQRKLELLAALTLGWLPGLLVQRIFGSVDPRITLTVVVLAIVVSVIDVFRAMRRFDREGRERYLRRVIAEESERPDAAR